MKRNAIPKRAISCIVALALVFSCLLTSYAGVTIIPFQGDNSTSGKGDVMVETNGGKVTWTAGNNGGSFTSQQTFSPALGEKCTFTAEDTSSRVFMYWQDEYSGRLFSYDRTVEFTVGSRMHLRAVYARVRNDKHTVAYVNYGGTVMQTKDYAVGATITPPTETKVPGFTFNGWSKDADAVSSDPSNQTVYALYTVNDESYTVTLTNEDCVSGAGTYSNFQTVNLKAEEKNGSGETFSYWKDSNDAVVSYERNYCFRINYDVTLTAVYGEDVTPEPVIRITKVNRDMPDMKLTFYAERSVPDTYTLVSHGILMATTAAPDSQMTLASAGEGDSATVRKVYGSSNEPYGTFSLAKAKVDHTTNVTARPFMVVQNADGEMFAVYGDSVCTTNGATD